MSGSEDVGYFRNAEGANASGRVFTPSSVLYVREGGSGSGSGSGSQEGDASSGLSSGAIAGIAVGATLGGLALAAAGWYIIRRCQPCKVASNGGNSGGRSTAGDSGTRTTTTIAGAADLAAGSRRLKEDEGIPKTGSTIDPIASPSESQPSTQCSDRAALPALPALPVGLVLPPDPEEHTSELQSH